MAVASMQTWQELNLVFDSNNLPIKAVPLVRGDPQYLGDSFEIEILAMGQPCWILSYETKTWIRISGNSYVESRELPWGVDLDSIELSIRIALETLWEFHISESGQMPISWEAFEDNLTIPVKAFWRELSGNKNTYFREVALEAIETWNEFVEIFGFDGGELAVEYLDENSKEADLDDYEHLEAQFRHKPKIAVVEKSLVGSEVDSTVWKTVRRQSVSATDARFLIKMNGQPRQGIRRILEEKIHDFETPFLDVFARGIEREPIIAAQISRWFEDLRLTHNRYLFVGENSRHVATPDMVGNGVLCEIKVLSKPLRSARTQYFDQMQWQMHVTGAERVLFAVENRYSEEIELEWIERDDHRISALVEAANDFLRTLDLENGKKAVEIQKVLFNFSMLDQVPETATKEELEAVSSASKAIKTEEVIQDSYKKIEEGKSDDFRPFKKWNKSSRKHLLKLYLGGSDCYEIAQTLGIEEKEAVSELARLILRPSGNLVDETAARFGLSWTENDHDVLALHYKLGLPLEQIASSIGRDQLGAAFVIFSKHSPKLPKKLVSKYSLKDEISEIPFLARGGNKEEENPYASTNRVRFLDFALGDQVLVHSADVKLERGIVKRLDLDDDTVLIELMESAKQYWFNFDEIKPLDSHI